MPASRFYRKLVTIGDDTYELLQTELKEGESANKILREFLKRRRLKRKDVAVKVFRKKRLTA